MMEKKTIKKGDTVYIETTAQNQDGDIIRVKDDHNNFACFKHLYVWHIDEMDNEYPALLTRIAQLQTERDALRAELAAMRGEGEANDAN